MWRQQQDKYAGEGHACSFFTLLMPGEVPQGAGAAKANGAVPGAEKSMSAKELRCKIAEAGLSCGDCVEKCELQERCRNALVLLKKLGGAKLVDSADRFVDVLVQDSKAMPKIVYDEGDCSICLEELTKPADDEEIHGHAKKTLSCGHTFHEYCFDKWLDMKHRHCPNCNLGHVRDKEGGCFASVNMHAPSAHSLNTTKTGMLPCAHESVRRFAKNKPFALKVQTKTSHLHSSGGLQEYDAPLMVYDETRELQFQVTNRERLTNAVESKKAQESGTCSLSELKLIAGAVRGHGSGAGEYVPPWGIMGCHVRGYLQACVIRRDTVRIYIDRVYSQHKKWF
jgi:hypothetical protein